MVRISLNRKYCLPLVGLRQRPVARIAGSNAALHQRPQEGYPTSFRFTERSLDRRGRGTSESDETDEVRPMRDETDEGHASAGKSIDSKLIDWDTTNQADL